MWIRRLSNGSNSVTVEQQQSQSQQPDIISVTVGQQRPQSQQPNKETESLSAPKMMLISPCWSVFDSVKTIPENPESLMSEINLAISNLEFARATFLLECQSPSSVSSRKKSSDGSTVVPQYDAWMADEAFKAACSALAAGKLDEAFQSLNVSLSKCPPDKTSAVAKLQSLISLTSQQLQRSAS